MGLLFCALYVSNVITILTKCSDVLICLRHQNLSLTLSGNQMEANLWSFTENHRASQLVSMTLKKGVLEKLFSSVSS